MKEEQSKHQRLSQHDTYLLMLYENILDNHTYSNIFHDGIAANYVYTGQVTCPFNMILHAIHKWFSSYKKQYCWKLHISASIHVIDLYIRLKHDLLLSRQETTRISPWQKPQWTFVDACSLTTWCIQKVFIRCCRRHYDSLVLLPLLHVSMQELDAMDVEIRGVVHETPQMVLDAETSLECIHNVEIQTQDIFRVLTQDPDEKWFRMRVAVSIRRDKDVPMLVKVPIRTIGDCEWKELVPDIGIEMMVREDFRQHHGRNCRNKEELRAFYVNFYFRGF